jgi:fructose-1,6-bisphosphatase/inositol monophosphatase family enzyme
MRGELLEVARAAADAVRDVADPAATVGSGYSGAPTSRLDQVAEEAVLAKVADLGLAVNVLTEERGWIDRGHGEVLVCDPVDGTVNALRGLGPWGVSLAVGREALSGLTHGLVYEPRTGDVYYAEKGKGATLNGKPLRSRTLGQGSSVFLVYLGQRAHPNAYRVAASGRRTRALGAASLELALVASGAANLYYFHSEADSLLRVVDIAAGVLLVREAGGLVVSLDRQPLDLPLTTAARTNLIAAGDEAVLEALP